jgi:RNA polymerase sigma-70 factor (ECF subfamily)
VNPTAIAPAAGGDPIKPRARIGCHFAFFLLSGVPEMTAQPPPPDSPHEMTDHSLLQKLKDGHQSAATALYHRYAGHLRALTARQSSAALSARMDVEDIVQSVFRTFFRRVNIDHYEVPRGEDLWKLFLVIALNKIRNAATHHTAAKRDVRQTIHLDNATDGLATTSTPSDVDLTALRMVIDDAIATLPETSRQIVRLRIEGHEVAEIAARASRSKRSVERVLQQFRDQLQGLLDDPA